MTSPYAAEPAAPACEPLATPQAKPTARDVKDALLRRYGNNGDQWVCIEEARSGAGFDGNNGACDFLAINTFKGRGMELVGHEVKVSLTDWKKELAQPEKAERFARHCRRWFVAVPADLAKKIKDEVPPAWGLLSLGPKGGLTEVVKAPARKPEPVPEWWWVGWLAQFDRQAKRRIPRLVDEAMRAEREQVQARIDAEVERRRRYAEDHDQALRDNAKALKEATGIDLAHAWSGTFKRLGAMYRLVQGQHVDLDGLVATLRRGADELEQAVNADATTEGPGKP